MMYDKNDPMDRAFLWMVRALAVFIVVGAVAICIAVVQSLTHAQPSCPERP